MVVAHSTGKQLAPKHFNQSKQRIKVKLQKQQAEKFSRRPSGHKNLKIVGGKPWGNAIILFAEELSTGSA
jgi:hypothetical protein